MEDGERLTYEQLRATARRAYRSSGQTQTDIAAALDVKQSAISLALQTKGPRYVRLQRRIIELLTPYTVKKEVRFILRQKLDEEAAD